LAFILLFTVLGSLNAHPGHGRFARSPQDDAVEPAEEAKEDMVKKTETEMSEASETEMSEKEESEMPQDEVSVMPKNEEHEMPSTEVAEMPKAEVAEMPKAEVAEMTKSEEPEIPKQELSEISEEKMPDIKKETETQQQTIEENEVKDPLPAPVKEMTEEKKVEPIEIKLSDEKMPEYETDEVESEENEVPDTKVKLEVIVPKVVTTTTTTTTTRRTTTTARPEPEDPGLLARLGSILNQGVGNIGGNIISGGSLLAAAASPLWAPLLVGKKRRKRDETNVHLNEIHDPKPLDYVAKMVMSHINQARQNIDKKTSTVSH